VVASAGEGCGGTIATFRYDVAPAAAAAHRARMRDEVVTQTAAAAGIAGCHLLVADTAASAVETAEKKARGGAPNRVPAWIVLVEGWGDEVPFLEWCESFARGTAFRDAGRPPEWSVYRLQNTRERAGSAP
jgi:FAD/FMN-containing dehydrogenase